MSSCQYAKDVIAHQLGLLDKESKKQFENHLKKCPVCQKEIQLQAIIREEFSQELEPGMIEQRILAILHLRRTLKPHLSWLYMIRMAIYGIAMMIGAFIIIPWLLEYPIGKLLNLNIDFNILGETPLLSGIFSYPYIFGFIIIILLGASSIYSYRLLHE